VLEKLDRFLSHPWVRRPTALFAVYGLIAFFIGAVATVLGPVTHTFEHAEVLGIVGVVLMVAGMLVIIVVGLEVRRLRNEASQLPAVVDWPRTTVKGHKIEGNRHEGWFTTRGQGQRYVDDIGTAPFSKVCFRSETEDHRSPDFYEACVRADEVPQEIRLGKHQFQRHPPRIVVKDITDAGILIEERDTGQQKVRIIGYMAPHTSGSQPPSSAVEAGQETSRGPAPPDQAVATTQAPQLVFDEAPPELADMSPASLKELFAGRTDAQGAKLTEQHVGKSVRVSGDVAKVELATVNSVTIRAAVTMILFFDNGAAEQLLALNLGDKVVVSGQIHGLSDGFIGLNKCKLVEARGRVS
jgi:hypothetical protein